MTRALVYYLEGNDLKLVAADAVMREGTTSSSEVTDNPVEEGANVTDNVRDKDDRLTLELTITNTPIDVPASHMSGVTGTTRDDGKGAVVLQFTGEFNRRRAVYDDLQRVRKLALRFSIETDLRDYEDFVIESISGDRDATSGSGVKITLQMKRIRFVTTRIVAVPQRLRRTLAPIPLGAHPPVPAREGLAHRAIRALTS